MPVIRFNEIELAAILRLIEKEIARLESIKYLSYQDQINSKIYEKLMNKLKEK